MIPEEKLNPRSWANHNDEAMIGDATEHDGMGCFGLTNKVALYEKMTLTGSQHYSSIFPIEDIDVTFTVRHAGDPMFLAKSLSDNSFDFGLSAHDSAALGFLGVIISLLLMFRPCIVICSIRRIPHYKDLEK